MEESGGQRDDRYDMNNVIAECYIIQQNLQQTDVATFRLDDITGDIYVCVE